MSATIKRPVSDNVLYGVKRLYLGRAVEMHKVPTHHAGHTLGTGREGIEPPLGHHFLLALRGSGVVIDLSEDRVGAGNRRMLIGRIQPIQGSRPVPLCDGVPFKRCNLEPRISGLWVGWLAHAIAIHPPKQHGGARASMKGGFLKILLRLSEIGQYQVSAQVDFSEAQFGGHRALARRRLVKVQGFLPIGGAPSPYSAMSANQ